MDNLVLFIIFGIVGVLCIFNLTMGKRNRQKATQHNKDVFGALRDKAVETFGQSKFDKMKKIPYMGDNSNGYILCFSKDADIMALVTYEEVFAMKFGSKKGCEVITDNDGRHFSSLVCRISAPELDCSPEVRLAENRHSVRSFMGKAILQDAAELKDIIEGKIPSDGEK